nr:MAG TPA_asm: Utp21 specific WD40 associated putative domain protein [Caudoviricetes sp.]
MCYNIDTVRERNKPKTKNQNPLPITNKFTASTKRRITHKSQKG